MSGRFDTFGYAGGELDAWDAAEGAGKTVEEDAALDPETAAALLEETSRQTQRRLDTRPPLLTLVGAGVVLVAFGAVWLSVRHQHPYRGPTGGALGVLYGILVAWFVLVAAVRRRATRGVGGRAAAERRVAWVAFAAIWIAVSVFQGALHHAGASHAVVYGIYPAAAPFVVVGSAAAAWEAAKENWRLMSVALVAVALGLGAAFAGPAAVWAVIGVGGCALLVVYAATGLVLRRG